MAATTEAVGIRILSDENVGSHMLAATMETWKDTVQALREGGNSATADAVTSLLRSANSSPSPGDVLEIEFMPSTETEAQLEAIQNAFPSDAEVEFGDYSRKTQTSRKTSSANKAASNGAARKSKKGTPRECGCGCGEMTGGGIFRPGHDARHKGNLLRRIDEGGADGEAALEELAKHPNLYDIDHARSRLGSGPTKKAEKDAQLQKLRDKKAAERAAAAEDDEDVEGAGEADEVEEEEVEEVKGGAKGKS